MEIVNWNTTNPLRIAMAEKLFNSFPFNTLTGLNEDK